MKNRLYSTLILCVLSVNLFALQNCRCTELNSSGTTTTVSYQVQDNTGGCCNGTTATALGVFTESLVRTNEIIYTTQISGSLAQSYCCT